MKLGVVFPQTEIGNDRAVIRDYVQAAEGLGYHHVLAFDHVLGIDPARTEGREVAAPLVTGKPPEGGWPKRKWQGYTNADAFHEPFVLFGFIAAATERIEMVTGVLILPQRQTALVAKQTAAIQVLSGGRLRLGVGVGWNPVEYEALGQRFARRGAREEEQIGLLRRLWSEEAVDFDGAWDRVTAAGIHPRPGQPIPVWVGGNSDAAMERAIRLGDGWLPSTRPEVFAEVAPRLRNGLFEAGRDPADFGVQNFTAFIPGDEARWERHLRAWAPLGVTHLCVDTMRKGIASPAGHIRAIEEYMRVARAVIDLEPARPIAPAVTV